MSLHAKILLGLVLGAIAGVTVNLVTDGGEGTQNFVRVFTEPVGRIWLNGLIMVIIPLIVSTLAVGVAGLGSLAKLGRVGAITLGSFIVLTALATILGLFAVNLLRPGAGLAPETTARLMETYKGQTDSAMGLVEGGTFGIDLLVRIVPRNPVQAAANGEMLAVIFFSIMLGVALTMVKPTQAEPLVKVLDSLAHATIAIISLVMAVAPIGVFALIFSVTARFGFEILLNLVWYVVTVVGALVVYQFAVYPAILKLATRRAPIDFLKKTRIVALTAFSTSSSNATLPTTLRVCEEDLGIPPSIAGFVIPLGATINMNGTAMFGGVTVLFIAQVFGVDLTLGQQAIVVIMSVVMAIGTAGVPGGAIPPLMIVLGMVGVPMEGIAIVLGVDRVLDMCRTAVNVTGDVVTATIVDRFEGGEAGRVPGRVAG